MLGTILTGMEVFISQATGTGYGNGDGDGDGDGDGNGKVPPVPGDDSIISGATTT